MCYNAAKSYQLGWYSAGTFEVDLTNGDTFIGNLYGVSDFGGTSVARRVLLKINTSSDVDYYVAFNRATGINEETREAGDMVTVVQQGGEGSSYSASKLLAKLSAGESYTFTGLSDMDTDLEVSVASIDVASSPGYAQVYIGPAGTAPTRAPTQAPTPVPTHAPTLKPTVNINDVLDSMKCMGKKKRACMRDNLCLWNYIVCTPKPL